MPAEEPTTPKDEAAPISPEGYLRDLQGRTGTAPGAEDEIETQQVEPEGTEEEGPKRVLSRRVRIAVLAALIVFAVALAWTVVPGLVGGGSKGRSRSSPGALPARVLGAGKRGPGRTRWVREPDAGAQPRRGPARRGTPQRRRRIHPRHELPPSVPAKPDVPRRPPEYGTTRSEAPAESSEPAPPPPAEPAGKPGLRDGATESAEFGL